jgi:PHD/YefM family antitoxin component YafN of YafNO toxin-antitoxin module
MPHRVINPRTDETFFLVTEDQYARLSDALEEEKTLSSLRMMALANALARGE